MRAIKDCDKCEYEDCERDSKEIVYSRMLEKVIICCEGHADVVEDEGHPEYNDQCKNCGCRQGVN
tara:strand:+ start:92 stop:286 length:195 start_codon:yes stop_codon:yes gene_type:complete